MRQIIILNIGAFLFLSLVSMANLEAQSSSRKELKRVFSELPSPAQDAVIDYAGSLITGEEAIADEKSLYKNYKFLSSDAQLDLMEFARKQVQPISEAAPELEEKAVTELSPPEEETAKVTISPEPTSEMPEEAPKPAWIQKAESLPKTTATWKKDNYSFGIIEQGKVAKYTYTFVNTGTEPLYLTRVKASCGCTVPRWSREPVAPGAEGQIEVSFSSRGRFGPVHKTISVTLNTDPIYKVLRFKGKIIEPQPKVEEQSTEP